MYVCDNSDKHTNDKVQEKCSRPDTSAFHTDVLTVWDQLLDP